MEPIEKYEHEGVPVSIYQDDHPHNPREDDQLAVLYCWHPDYTLGDEQFTRDDHDSMEDVIEYLRTERKAVVIIPLFLLDHSGISMNAGRALDLEAFSRADIEARGRFVGDGAGWDTTHVGFAYVTIARAVELGVTSPRGSGTVDLDELTKQAHTEVEEYDQFLTGDAYGYIVDEDGDNEESVWGFLGMEAVREEANSTAAWVAKQRVKEATEAAAMAARDIITI